MDPLFRWYNTFLANIISTAYPNIFYINGLCYHSYKSIILLLDIIIATVLL